MNHEIEVNARLSIPYNEFAFQTSRSGGPGGQNVNRRESRVELFFDIVHSPSLPEETRRKLIAAFRDRLNADGCLRVVSQRHRHQWQNREDAVLKLIKLLKTALIPKKHRERTTPTKTSKEKRLQEKKAHSAVKRLRTQRPKDEEEE